MSTSKFAGLEGVDYAAPDVFETRSPSPSQRTKTLRGGARGAYGSSDDDDSDEEGESSELDDEDRHGAARMSRRSNKKIGGHGGGAGQSHRSGTAAAAGHSNPDIVSTSLNADEAAKRFRGATGIDATDVDFTSTIHRRKKKPQYYPRPDATYETVTYSLGSGSGYRAVDGTSRDGDPWVRVSDEREPPTDRFRRLRYEIEELEQELQQRPKSTDGQLQNDTGDANTSARVKEPVVGSDGQQASLLGQLHSLRDHMGRLEAKEALQSGLSQSGAEYWQKEARRLLEELSKSSKVAEHSSSGAVGKNAIVSKEGGESATVQTAGLDRRLAGLEELVGIRAALQDESKTLPRPLLPSIARIEHLLTLLTQPRHLDAISRRIKVLVSELERVHEARRKLATASGDTNGAGSGAAEGGSGGAKNVAMAPETLKRLDGVLPLLSKIEPMLPVVPALLARLQTLSTLHAGSASFAHEVEALTGLARASRTQNDELATMLANVERSVGDNQSRIEGNFSVIEERIEALMKRVEGMAPRAT